jgi:hypothetical protein
MGAPDIDVYIDDVVLDTSAWAVCHNLPRCRRLRGKHQSSDKCEVVTETLHVERQLNDIWAEVEDARR